MIAGNVTLAYALEYAKLGFKVFPCRVGGKEPAIKAWDQQATSDPAQIEKWFTENPNYNLAVAMGHGSLVAVDLDMKNGVNGFETVKALGVPLPKTCVQLTPSGGMHLFYRTEDLPKNRVGYMSGVDMRSLGGYVLVAPSVVDDTPYAWDDKLSPWDVQPAELPEVLRPPTRKRKPAPAVEEYPPATEEEVEIARRYIDSVPAAEEGKHGHTALLWAATTMTWGCGLNHDQAIDVLWELYNPRCIPPWDYTNEDDRKEFERKVDEAIKKPPSDKPRKWIIDSRPKVDDALVDALIEALPWAPGHGPPPDPEDLDDDLDYEDEVDDTDLDQLYSPPGLVGEICEWMDSRSMMVQPALTLGASLSLMGTLIGRKLTDHLGSRPKLYCIGVAESSWGKSSGIDGLVTLISHCGLSSIIGGMDIASDTAIEQKLSEIPSRIFILDEVGKFFGSIKNARGAPFMARIPECLTKMWSAKDLYIGKAYADAEKQRTVVDPCCNLYGTAQPNEFAKGMTPDQLNDGFLARILLFPGMDNVKKRYDVNTLPPRTGVVERVRELHAFSTGVDNERPTDLSSVIASTGDGGYISTPQQKLIVPYTENAEDAFRKLDEEFREYGKKDQRMEAIWAKGEEQARRVALLVAAGCGLEGIQVTREIAEYSCNLVRHSIRSFGRMVGGNIVENEVESQTTRMLRAIEKHVKSGRKMTKSSLYKYTQYLTKNQRESALHTLIESGLVVCVPLKQGGAAYYPIKEYKKLKARGELP